MTTTTLCRLDDLAKGSGVCAIHKDTQVAVYYLPDTDKQIYALGNWDPLGRANVMSRGIVGSISDELVVASPLYKQHFSLTTGRCLEEEASLPVFDVSIDGDLVVITS